MCCPIIHVLFRTRTPAHAPPGTLVIGLHVRRGELLVVGRLNLLKKLVGAKTRKQQEDAAKKAAGPGASS